MENSNAVERWIEAQVSAGAGTRDEIVERIHAARDFNDLPYDLREALRADAIRVFEINSVDDKQAVPGIRRTMEHVTFSLMSIASVDEQKTWLASLFAKAQALDEGTKQIRGQITQLEKEMPREEVWRFLQSVADSYRAGEPLCMLDRCVLLANEHLTRDVMADALFENDTKAANARKAVREKVSKTIARAQDAQASALPLEVREPDAVDRFPLLVDLGHVAKQATKSTGLVLVNRDGSHRAVADDEQRVADHEQPLPWLRNG